MADRDQEERIVQFSNLNLLGKAVFVGGAVTRATTHLIERAISATADMVVETEKAFKQGLDPNIEDANIIDENDEEPG